MKATKQETLRLLDATHLINHKTVDVIFYSYLLQPISCPDVSHKFGKVVAQEAKSQNNLISTRETQSFLMPFDPWAGTHRMLWIKS